MPCSCSHGGARSKHTIVVNAAAIQLHMIGACMSARGPAGATPPRAGSFAILMKHDVTVASPGGSLAVPPPCIDSHSRVSMSHSHLDSLMQLGTPYTHAL